MAGPALRLRSAAAGAIATPGDGARARTRVLRDTPQRMRSSGGRARSSGDDEYDDDEDEDDQQERRASANGRRRLRSVEPEEPEEDEDDEDVDVGGEASGSGEEGEQEVFYDAVEDDSDQSQPISAPLRSRHVRRLDDSPDVATETPELVAIVPLASTTDLASHRGRADRPPFALGVLVDAAIRFSDQRMRTEQDICEWIEDTFPFYARADDGWQHTINAILTGSTHFVRAPRTPRSPKGHGSMWAIAGLPVVPVSESTHRHSFQHSSPTYKKKDKGAKGAEADNDKKRVFVHRHYDGTLEAYSRAFLDHLELDLDEEEAREQSIVLIPIEDRWKNEWNDAVQIPTKQLTSLPRAVVNVVEAEPPAPAFTMPAEYIEYAGECTAVSNDRVLYDLRGEDFDFFDVLRRIALPRDKLTEDKLEAILDQLEKAYGRAELATLRQLDEQKSSSGVPSSTPSVTDDNDDDDLIRCCICQETESEDTNELVFCDGCSAAVHQACYGILNVPEARWFCSSCSSNGDSIKCMLCPNRGGPMKRTDKGLWCHSACALWIPETGFEDVLRMEPIVQTETIHEDRFRLGCVLCHVREGACIQCAQQSCFAPFHVSCAMLHGLAMEIREKKGVVHKDVFCLKHSASRSQSHQRPLMNAHAQTLPLRFDPTKVTPESIAKRFSISSSAASRIVVYWTLQRKKRNGRPLLNDIAVQSFNLLQKISSMHRYRQFNARAESFRPFAFFSLDELRAKHWDIQTSHSLTRLLSERGQLQRKRLLLSKTLLDETLTALTATLLRLLDALSRITALDLEARLASAVHATLGASVEAWRSHIERGEYGSLARFAADLRDVVKRTEPVLRLPAAEKASAHVQAAATALGALSAVRPRTLMKDTAGNALSLEAVLLTVLVVAGRELQASVQEATAPIQAQLADTAAQLLQTDVNISKVTSEDEIRERRQTVELRSLLSDLERCDTYQIFAEPVSTDVVPDYLLVIEHPMDFSTMRTKLETGEYDNDFAQVLRDFRRIITNCVTYNAEGSDYYVEALNVRHVGKKILKKFVRAHPELDLAAALDEFQQPLPRMRVPKTPPPLKRRKSSDAGSEALGIAADGAVAETAASSAPPSVPRNRQGRRPSGQGPGVPAETFTCDVARRAVDVHLASSKWGSADFASLKSRLQRVLDIMVLLDSNGFFLTPVSLPEPLMSTYRELVPTPMDLSTMARKVAARTYKSLEHFGSDLARVFTNCFAFNNDDSIYVAEARKMKDVADKLLAMIQDAHTGDATSRSRQPRPSGSHVPGQPNILPHVERSPLDLVDLLGLLERYDWDGVFQGAPRRGDPSRPDLGVVRWRLASGHVDAMPKFVDTVNGVWAAAFRQTRDDPELQAQAARMMTTSDLLFSAYERVFAEDEPEQPALNEPLAVRDRKRARKAKSEPEPELEPEPEPEPETERKPERATRSRTPTVVDSPRLSRRLQIAEPEPVPTDTPRALRRAAATPPPPAPSPLRPPRKLLAEPEVLRSSPRLHRGTSPSSAVPSAPASPERLASASKSKKRRIEVTAPDEDDDEDDEVDETLFRRSKRVAAPPSPAPPTVVRANPSRAARPGPPPAPQRGASGRRPGF